ncbi:MAG: hypothetical protein B7Z16_13585 [Algoriphagus sp. 32-45-6]|nr:MAG: hypothetical protein B7Z16_13585 [Algoriphagus sp. 32-45-6]
MKKAVILILFSGLLSSCSCSPEDLMSFAFRSMESVMGDGFFPSEEVLKQGNFRVAGVSMQSSGIGEDYQSLIELTLKNGDPKLLNPHPEIVARKCAELYLRDFEKKEDYQTILIRFEESYPENPQDIAIMEFSFEVKDF